MSNGGWGDPNELDMSDVHGDEDLENSRQDPADGVYHLCVEEVDERREKVDAMKIKFVVMRGTTPGQEGKRFVETFFDPKASQKDGGKFCRKRLIRFAKAMGLITPADYGTKVRVNWQDALYRHCVAGVESYERESNGKKYTGSQIANGGTDVWGPRDDEAAGCPLDEDALLAAAEVQLNAAPRALAANPATNATTPAAAPPPPAPPRRPQAPAPRSPQQAGAGPAGAGAAAGAKDPYAGI